MIGILRGSKLELSIRFWRRLPPERLKTLLNSSSHQLLLGAKDLVAPLPIKDICTLFLKLRTKVYSMSSQLKPLRTWSLRSIKMSRTRSNSMWVTLSQTRNSSTDWCRYYNNFMRDLSPRCPSANKNWWPTSTHWQGITLPILKMSKCLKGWFRRKMSSFCRFLTCLIVIRTMRIWLTVCKESLRNQGITINPHSRNNGLQCTISDPPQLSNSREGQEVPRTVIDSHKRNKSPTLPNMASYPNSNQWASIRLECLKLSHLKSASVPHQATVNVSTSQKTPSWGQVKVMSSGLQPRCMMLHWSPTISAQAKKWRITIANSNDNLYKTHNASSIKDP